MVEHLGLRVTGSSQEPATKTPFQFSGIQPHVSSQNPAKRLYPYVKNDVTGTVRTRLAFRPCGMFVNQDVVDMRSVQQAIKGSQSLPETTHS